MGQVSFINFDYEKPESYVDDFARQMAINIMPVVGYVVCAVVSMFMLVQHDPPWKRCWRCNGLLALALM